MTTIRVRRPPQLVGHVELPGDKSISHRALILNAIAEGTATVRNLSGGADVVSTAACLRALGVEIEGDEVRGVGLDGLRAAADPLDCGNSGTTMRLLAGLLAPQPFESRLTGDESLRGRPMDRVVEPLRRMGAAADAPPLVVGGRRPLRGIAYRMPVASAQVKSAVLLAGLYASGRTAVIEPAPTRNHTELMLAAMGAPIGVQGIAITIDRAERLKPIDVDVPGDLSAAAFWLVAGALHPHADLTLEAVGVNPTRTALLRVLEESLGARVEVRNRRLAGPEPVADLAVATGTRGGPLKTGRALAAQLIDELPVLAVAAALLPGEHEIRGAGELRVKESDRIGALAAGLAAMGADVEELSDGLRIRGPRPLEGARVESRGDHRIAMAFAVAGMLADGVTEIADAGSAAVSDPGFWEQAARFGAVK
ncbi:MAG TPA: 3-phosphoshikimate 1-carboxyvinyltransferase [Candidatus Dormibacteraeota bacterium]